MFYYLKALLFIDVLVASGLLLFRLALLPRHRAVVSGKIVTIALATPAVALLCGNVYLFYLYLTMVIAFGARSRLEIAGIFLFLLPSMPLLSVETRVGGVYLFAISALVAMGMGALIGVMVTRRRNTRTLIRYDIGICILVGLFTFINSRDPFGFTIMLREAAYNSLTIGAPYLLVSRGAGNAVEVERLLLRWTLGATVMAVTACFQAWRRWVLFETYYQALHVRLPIVSAALSIRGGLLRTGGSMVDYSAGGLFLATALTALPLLRRAFRPAGYWMAMATLIVGLFATQSRGAWVAAIVGLVVAAAWRGQWGRVLLLAGGTIVVQVAITVFATSGRLAQILGQAGAAKDTAVYRRDLAARGIEQIKSHPLLGQSPEQLVHNLADLTQGEHIVDFVNSHLFIAMAAGVPLFCVWCFIWLAPVVEGWRDRRSSLLLAAAPTAIIVPALVALTFTSMGERNLTWPIIAVALAVPCLTMARKVAPARPKSASDWSRR